MARLDVALSMSQVCENVVESMGVSRYLLLLLSMSHDFEQCFWLLFFWCHCIYYMYLLVSSGTAAVFVTPEDLE